MRSSDIAKLAASIAAGSVTYSAVINQLDDDGDVSLLDSLLAGGAAAVAGAVVSEAMDATGISDLIDDIF